MKWTVKTRMKTQDGSIKEQTYYTGDRKEAERAYKIAQRNPSVVIAGVIIRGTHRENCFGEI